MLKDGAEDKEFVLKILSIPRLKVYREEPWRGHCKALSSAPNEDNQRDVAPLESRSSKHRPVLINYLEINLIRFLP